MDSVSLPQNWYFLSFPKSFLAARGYSPRNPDAFLGSVPDGSQSNTIRQKTLREAKKIHSSAIRFLRPCNFPTPIFPR